MKYARIQNRMGATAIAAVLALSSTPLVAQEAPSLATPPIEAPTADPTPTTEPAPNPLAAEPAPEASTPAETTTVEAAEPAPAARSVTKKATIKPARTAERAPTRAAAPKAAVEPMPDASPEPAAAAPASAAWTAAEAPQPEAPAAPEPQQNAQLEEALPLAGGAGAVILALAGAGMAVRRRKRREEDELVLDNHADAESTGTTFQTVEAEEPAPAWSEPVIQPKPAPVIPVKMETDVSDDFDTSRFGRHVQAAYRGPTPENPSLSLRKRLKLAAELDRRERKLEGIAKPATKPVTASMPAHERPAISFGGTATKAKTPEYQL